MMRTAVLFAASLMLMSCNGRSSLPAEPVAQPAPVAADPRLCAPLEAEPLAVGSIVAPATAEEVAATRDHLTSDAEGRAWGRRGWDRAAVAAATECRPSG